jgi:phosphoglycolate phosphatase-like HAD superfamily hydrolase
VNVLIFDFDGTIADSFEIVLAITNRLAPEFGYPPALPEDVERLRNLSSREIVRQSKVSPFKIPFLVRRLRGELYREIPHLQPIPGIKAALLDLKQQGYQLGIVTSNSRKNVVAFLAAQQLSDMFDFIGSGIALFGKDRILRRILKQQQLNPRDVVYVGDETRDIEAARTIGIKVISVSWGYNTSQALAAENPDYLIHQPAELLQIAEWA